MIITSKLEKPYVEMTIRSYIWFKCDYCECEFQRDKKSRERLNKIIQKDSCGKKECKKNKNKDINIKKFGVPHLFQSEEFKQKNKTTCLEKYGSEQYYSSEDFKQKRLESLEKNFGVDSPLKNAEIQKKHKNTMKKKHGVENASQSKEFKNKSKQTSRENHGVDFPMQSQSILENRKNTNLNRYGVENYTQTEEYWQKRQETTLAERGCLHTSQDPVVRKKYLETISKKYDGATNLSEVPGVLSKIHDTMMEKYGVPSALCLPENRIYGKTEEEIRSWINEFGFSFKSDYTILNGKELDAYDNDLKIAIEYCGLFWHNEMSKTPRLRRYHYNKHLKCLEKSIRLITIFEDEWKSRNKACKNFIKSILNRCKVNLFARNCSVQEISLKDHRAFCESNHILGANTLSKIAYGLFYESKIIGTISLGRHHRGSNDIILDRLCFEDDVKVIGGSSKLFSRCVTWAKAQNYSKIISWSDNRWSMGHVYTKLNFILEKEYGPDYSYVNISKPYCRISKQSQKKKSPSAKTERDICLEIGLARIWDCGKKKWLFNIV